MKKDIKQSNKRIQNQFKHTLMNRDIINKDIEHLRFLRDLFSSDYRLSLFYYQRYNHLLILYPFYCKEPVLELGQEKLEEVKIIMFGVRCIHSEEKMPEEDMYRKAIQRVMIGVAFNEDKLTRDSYNEGGDKLFNGGFEI